jgi:hypothetical protein
MGTPRRFTRVGFDDFISGTPKGIQPSTEMESFAVVCRRENRIAREKIMFISDPSRDMVSVIGENKRKARALYYTVSLL